MVEPEQVIEQTRRRLARVGAARTLLKSAPLALSAAAIALAIRWLGGRGALLAQALARPRFIAYVEELLWGLALAAAATALALAWRQAWRAGGFADAGRELDELLDAHQEVLTFAVLTDPSRAAREARQSPFFALLRGRVAARLDRLDLRRAFALRAGLTLRRGLPYAGAVVLAAALLLGAGLVPQLLWSRAGAPLAQLAHQVKDASSAVAKALAPGAKAAAKLLVRTLAPRAEKPTQLAGLEPRSAAPHQSTGFAQGVSGRNPAGYSGSHGQGAGQGQGTGTGSGGQGAGPGRGEGNRPGAAAANDIKRLENEASPSKAQLETGSGEKIPTAQNPDNPGRQTAQAAAASGKSRNQLERPGQAGKQQSAAGDKPASRGRSASDEAKNRQPQRGKGGSLGDTRPGEFPSPGNPARFYRPGEHGPKLAVQDARYVTFQLPAGVLSAGAGGRLMAGSERATAKTPYTRAGLGSGEPELALRARQNIPPRYQDLIR